jgi:hypothetical protein
MDTLFSIRWFLSFEQVIFGFARRCNGSLFHWGFEFRSSKFEFLPESRKGVIFVQTPIKEIWDEASDNAADSGRRLFDVVDLAPGMGRDGPLCKHHRPGETARESVAGGPAGLSVHRGSVQ